MQYEFSIINHKHHNLTINHKHPDSIGDLFTNGQLQIGTQNLSISAISQGRKSVSSKQVKVYVTVREVSPPHLTPTSPSPIQFNVAEDISPSEPIGQLTVKELTSSCKHTVLTNTAGAQRITLSEKDGILRAAADGVLESSQDRVYYLRVRVVCGERSIQLRATVKVTKTKFTGTSIPHMDRVYLHLNRNLLAPSQIIHRFNQRYRYYLQTTTFTIFDSEFAKYFTIKGDALMMSANYTASTIPDFLKTNILLEDQVGNIENSKIEVHIKGIHDLPRFPSAVQVISVPETAQPPRHLVHRFDPPPMFYVYSLSSSSDYFDLLGDGRLLLTRAMNMHERDSFELWATLNGPYSNSTCRLLIFVKDANDQAPVVNQNPSVFTLFEGFIAGQRLGRIEAFDASVNGILQYSLTEDRRFSVDAITGELYVRQVIPTRLSNPFNRVPPFSSEDSIKLELVVSDLGTQHLSTSFVTTVKRKWSTDTQPRFYPLDDYSHFYVAEDQMKTFKIGQFSIIPASSMDRVSFVLIPSQDALTFYVDENGFITLNSYLDREINAEYKFEVLLTDKLDDRRILDNRTVVVTVEDVNDNAPIFQTTQTKYELLDNIDIGKHVLTFAAYDIDSGINARITYALEASSTVFVIHPNLGIVVLNETMKAGDQHSLRCIASDGEGVSSYIDFRILVKESSPNYDHPIVFLDAPHTISVPESTPIHSKIATFQATTKPFVPDVVINYELMWVWPSSEFGASVFHVDRVSGELTFDTAALDALSAPIYSMSVRAFEVTSTVTNLSHIATLSQGIAHDLLVNVTYVRDRAVVCTSSQAVLVPMKSSVGGDLSLNYAIDCNDPDTTSQPMVYTLDSSRLDGSLFSLHDGEYLRFATSGQLPQAGVYNAAMLANAASYVISVLVGSMSSDVVFHKYVYGVEILESSAPGVVLATLGASIATTDESLATSGDTQVTFNYYLLTGTPHFAVNATTGALTTTNSPLDVDQMPHSVVELKVAAVRTDNFDYNTVTVSGEPLILF